MICLRSGRRRWTPVRDDERKPGRRFEERSGSLRREKRDKNQKLDNKTLYHEQRFDIEKYKSILKGVCKNYRAPFSLDVIEGGYFHEDGSWVDENTLLVTFIGIRKRTVYEIARDICTFFRQETVMITLTPSIRFNIHDGLASEEIENMKKKGEDHNADSADETI